MMEMAIVEAGFTHNAAFFTSPVMLVAIPAGICIYSFLTFLPKWMLDGKLKQNLGRAGIITMGYLFVVMATVFGSQA